MGRIRANTKKGPERVPGKVESSGVQENGRIPTSIEKGRIQMCTVEWKKPGLVLEKGRIQASTGEGTIQASTGER